MFLLRIYIRYASFSQILFYVALSEVKPNDPLIPCFIISITSQNQTGLYKTSQLTRYRILHFLLRDIVDKSSLLISLIVPITSTYSCYLATSRQGMALLFNKGLLIVINKEQT